MKRERVRYELPPEVSEWAYSEEEMGAILRINVNTLRARISCGTNHPPYKEWVRGVLIFPKAEFKTWSIGKPIIYEVKSAG